MSSITPHLTGDKGENPAILGAPLISVVIPILNEAAVLLSSHQRVCSALDSLGDGCEIVYIDDGFSDAGWHLLQERHSQQHRLVRLVLNPNWGKQTFISAGLKACQGKGVIILDADLQGSLELIWRHTE